MESDVGGSDRWPVGGDALYFSKHFFILYIVDGGGRVVRTYHPPRDMFFLGGMDRCTNSDTSGDGASSGRGHGRAFPLHSTISSGRVHQSSIDGKFAQGECDSKWGSRRSRPPMNHHARQARQFVRENAGAGGVGGLRRPAARGRRRARGAAQGKRWSLGSMAPVSRASQRGSTIKGTIGGGSAHRKGAWACLGVHSWRARWTVAGEASARGVCGRAARRGVCEGSECPGRVLACRKAGCFRSTDEARPQWGRAAGVGARVCVACRGAGKREDRRELFEEGSSESGGGRQTNRAALSPNFGVPPPGAVTGVMLGAFHQQCKGFRSRVLRTRPAGRLVSVSSPEGRSRQDIALSTRRVPQKRVGCPPQRPADYKVASPCLV